MADPTSLGVSSSMMEDPVVRGMLQAEDISNDADTVMGDPTMDLHQAMAAVEAAQRADEEQQRQQQAQRQQQTQSQQQQLGMSGTVASNTSGTAQGNLNGAQISRTALLESNGSPVNNELSRISTTPLCSKASRAQGLTTTVNDSVDMDTDTENATSPTDPTVSTTVVSPPSICLCQQPQRIPRPRNAFILFRQHHHAQVVSANPGKANPEISKIIGEMWRESTPESKAIWQKHADDEKQKHIQRFPEYRYQPRRNGKRNIAALSGGNGGLSLSLESATCPNCGGRTGAMSAAPTPATPNFPRQFKPAPPSMNKRPSLSILPATPSFLKTQHNEKKPDPSSISKIGTGVEALMRLGVSNDSEDDPSPTSPTNHHLQQRKRTKMNHIISTHQLMRDLQTPGLLQAHGHSHTVSDQLDPFTLHGPDGGLKHHTQHNPHFDSNAASELEQQMLALQAQGYELGTPSPATTHQPSNLLRQSTHPSSTGQMSIFDKIADVRRTCKSLPALPTQGAQARGAVIAIEGDDKNLVNALTCALADNLKGAEKVDVLTLEEPGDALPTFNASNGLDFDEENEIRMAKLFENVAKYRRKALGIRYSVIGSGRNNETPGTLAGLKINTSSSVTGNEDAEGETDSQFGLSPLDTSPSTFHSMQHLHPNHHLNHNHSPISPASSLSHLQTSHPHNNGMHLPTPTSPSSKIPILLLNRYILSLSDTISSSLHTTSPSSSSPNHHSFSPTPTTPQQTSTINTIPSLSTPPQSPADEKRSSWNYALSLFKGVTAPDMIIYVESPPTSSSTFAPSSSITSHPNGLAKTPTNQNAELDVREDERIVILRGWNQPGKLGGNERVVRRLGFEVSEVLRQLQGFVG